MEIKNTITEMKNTVDRVNSKLNDTEEQSSELEVRVGKITDAEQKKKKRNEDSLYDQKSPPKQKPRARWLHRGIRSNI